MHNGDGRWAFVRRAWHWRAVIVWFAIFQTWIKAVECAALVRRLAGTVKDSVDRKMGV
jgi:hypothetical protein